MFYFGAKLGGGCVCVCKDPILQASFVFRHCHQMIKIFKSGERFLFLAKGILWVMLLSAYT